MAIQGYINAPTPSDPTVPATTTNGAITAAVTSITFVSVADVPSSGQFTILIENELILVTSLAGLVGTVTRGQEGTTAATHASGTSVYCILSAAALSRLPRSMTTSGDTEYLNSSGAPTRLAAPSDGDYVTRWTTGVPSWVAGAAGSVTSVAMSVPSILSVSGSPVTSSGTLAVTLATQTANLVFAGPTSGGVATPTFRALVNADIPSTLTPTITGLTVSGIADTRVVFSAAGVLTGDGALTFNPATGRLSQTISAVGATRIMHDLDYTVGTTNSTGVTGINAFIDIQTVAGQTLDWAKGWEATIEHGGDGDVTALTGLYVEQSNYGGGHIATQKGVNVWIYGDTSGSTFDDLRAYEALFIPDSGAVVSGNLFAFWTGGSLNSAAHSYSFWSEMGAGVYRIKVDNTFNSVYQNIPALYNPQFTKYTAGAANYERIVQQWESNVATIRTEASGTGTLRALNLAGSIVQINGTTIAAAAFIALPVAVANGGTGASSASITAFNNITGFTAAGSTGTTSTNLVFSTSPTLVTPTLGVATGTRLGLGVAADAAIPLIVRGSGATAATVAATIEDSGGTDMLTVNDLSQLGLGKSITLGSNTGYVMLTGGADFSTIVSITSAGTQSAVVGFLGVTLRTLGAGNYTSGRGLDFTFDHRGTHASSAIRGMYGSARLGAASARAATLIGGAFDANTNDATGGTVTTLAGVSSAAYLNTAGVTITSAYGVRVEDLVNAGTITNTYGIYVGDLTTGTQTNQAYSLYLSDTNARNYLGGNTQIVGSLTISANNIVTDTTTGMKIGTATTQKLGLWNVTPIVQPAGAGQAAFTDSTGGTPAASLVDVGVVFSQTAINANFATVSVLLLAMRTAMVNSGLMKGAA